MLDTGSAGHMFGLLADGDFQLLLGEGKRSSLTQGLVTSGLGNKMD